MDSAQDCKEQREPKGAGLLWCGQGRVGAGLCGWAGRRPLEAQEEGIPEMEREEKKA